MRKEEVKAIRAWAEENGIADELSVFEDSRPPLDKPKQGIKYIKVGESVDERIKLAPGYSLYRKVKTDE